MRLHFFFTNNNRRKQVSQSKERNKKKQYKENMEFFETTPWNFSSKHFPDYSKSNLEILSMKKKLLFFFETPGIQNKIFTDTVSA